MKKIEAFHIVEKREAFEGKSLWFGEEQLYRDRDVALCDGGQLVLAAPNLFMENNTAVLRVADDLSIEGLNTPPPKKAREKDFFKAYEKKRASECLGRFRSSFWNLPSSNNTLLVTKKTEHRPQSRESYKKIADHTKEGFGFLIDSRTVTTVKEIKWITRKTSAWWFQNSSAVYEASADAPTLFRQAWNNPS